MQVSYQWLQKSFKEELPDPEKVSEILMFHAFEIEGVEKRGDDVVIDVDVLPNRSSDCFSHRGIVKELSVLLKLPMKHDPLREELEKLSDSSKLAIDVSDSKLCRRYSAAVLLGVKVGPSPDWLKKSLEALGQKSINNIVDATNYVMFDLGQPLHAFDANKLEKKDDKWTVGVRTGKKGEKITTLDDTTYDVDEETLLIVDGVSDTAIGIAGVKGGKVAEVDEKTTDLIIESANFDPVSVWKTGRRLKLRTDASARFENEPPQELTMYALSAVTKLILDIAGGKLEGVVDVFPKPNEVAEVGVTIDEINNLLGSDIKEKEVEDIFTRFGFSYTHRRGNFTVSVPFERLDLRIKEDLIEEVGRVYGYENIPSVLPKSQEGELEINKRFYYTQKVRNFLKEKGFSEVYTYALRDSGEVELANPLASDKAFMRKSLRDGLAESLELNRKNAPLLGLPGIKIFEIGTVFTKDGEHTELGIGILPVEAKKRDSIQQELFASVLQGLKELLSVEDLRESQKTGVSTINFEKLIEALPEPKEYEPYHKPTLVTYKPFSLYPFALRDIAVWTPAGTKGDDVIALVREQAGDLLVNYSLFDTFEKDGRVSYAFHLVLQSSEKTLSESELTGLLEGIYKALRSQENWEIR